MGSSHNDDQHASQRDFSEIEEDYDTIKPVVVTGFGNIDGPPSEDANCTDANKVDESNFSWRVVEKLSETINFGEEIPVLKGEPAPCSGHDNTSGPPQAVRVCYSYVQSEGFQNWLNSANAQVYVHLGVKSGKENCIYLETTADRNVDFTADYYGEIPLVCISESAPLKTMFDCSDLCDKLKQKFKSVTIPQLEGSSRQVELSFEVPDRDNAGDFLCNFLYYESLYLASKRGGQGLNVLFVHVPETLILSNDTQSQNVSESDKAMALAPVIEFIVQELLQQHSDLMQKHRVIQKPILRADTPAMVFTGFGPIKPGGDTNISATVMQEFYRLYNGIFTILTGPDMVPATSDDPQPPVETSYAYVTSLTFDDWLSSTDARLYIHLGTKSNESYTEQRLNPIYFEQQAFNKGHDNFWMSDYYGSKEFEYCVPDGPRCLKTSFNISDLINKVKTKISQLTPGTIKGANTLSFVDSDDAGTFLCEFLYYRSLYYRNCTNVIFIHIPDELAPGISIEDVVLVLEQIVLCLLDMQSQGEENVTVFSGGDTNDDGCCSDDCKVPTVSKPLKAASGASGFSSRKRQRQKRKRKRQRRRNKMRKVKLVLTPAKNLM